MSNDLKNILSNLNNDIEQEKLLEYINRTLTTEQQHELESQLNDDLFMSDAVDGLSHIQKQSPDKIALMVHQLNKNLKTQLEKKKKRKTRFITETPWLYYTAIILFVIAVIGYIVIKKITG